MKEKQCNCIQILEAVWKHSKGKACSRYSLALERAIECLEAGTSNKAIKKWESYFDKK